ncbi:Set1/Ash2 histone methyltransferase complex subunit ASH2 [Boothiomyces sp. JEL0866]|nr:Set1/Ash2 histone methyltransferase complex subunit ASH2 [Boothiomyces sp. JEL0866]
METDYPRDPIEQESEYPLNESVKSEKYQEYPQDFQQEQYADDNQKEYYPEYQEYPYYDQENSFEREYYPETQGEKKECYCGNNIKSTRPPFTCINCNNKFHQQCVDIIKDWKNPPLHGDDHYAFLCKNCGHGQETIKRTHLAWVDVVHIALFNLTISTPSKYVAENRKYYHWKQDICTFIDQNWSRFWIRSRTQTWKNSVASCLSTGNRFVSGTKYFDNEQGMWALDQLELLNANEQSKKARSVAFGILSDGELYEIEENKKKRKGDEPKQERKKKKTGFKLDDEFVNPATAIMIYPDIDNPVNEPVVISNVSTHTAPQLKVSADGLSVSNEKGYRMAKASHGVWEGYWYYEVVLTSDAGNTRIGWSQISGDLQAPCGYDQFSYSFRNDPGALFHQSKSQPCDDSYLKGYKKGDVLGLAIYLPAYSLEKYNIQVDPILLRRLWDPTRMQQYLPFKTNPIDKLPKSKIEYFLNGKPLGIAFTDLYLGKYHPTVSLYKGASVTVNFGPNFAHQPPANCKGYHEAQSLPQWIDVLETYKRQIHDYQENLKIKKKEDTVDQSQSEEEHPMEQESNEEKVEI